MQPTTLLTAPRSRNEAATWHQEPVEPDRALLATHSNGKPRGAKLLEVSHLRKSYGSMVAVDDLSFHVNAGEIFGLVGPNGAGKSTTMMILAGIRRADGGQVAIDGHPAGQGHRAIQSMLGVVPQDLAIYADLTARENLNFFGQIYRVRGAELKSRVDRILAQIGLEAQADQYVRTFSGGMKRRLNFGLALIHEPQLVILDEPTVGVDPQSRSHLLDCIRQLAARGVGVIYASHYMEEVEAICQRVAIIDHGKLLAVGRLEELIDKSHAELHLRVAAPEHDLTYRLRDLADVVATDGVESEVVVRRERKAGPRAVAGRLPRVVDLLTAAGIEILSIDTRRQNLERLFLGLTGRKLRD
jgi:ABC-2 type transport system ATP-binding protein